METAVIIDCIVAAALLGFLIYGAWRGLFRAVAGLLVIVISICGAAFLARQLTPMATELLRPVIATSIEKKVSGAMSGDALDGEAAVTPVKPSIEEAAVSAPAAEDGAQTQTQASELLKLMGLGGDLTKSLAGVVKEKVESTGVSLAMAVVDSLMESVVYVILFTIAFIVLTLLLRLAEKAINLAMELPGFHALNTLGGGAVGLLEGALLVFLAIWLLEAFSISLDTETVEKTRLLSFFLEHSPLDLLFL